MGGQNSFGSIWIRLAVIGWPRATVGPRAAPRECPAARSDLSFESCTAWRIASLLVPTFGNRPPPDPIRWGHSAARGHGGARYLWKGAPLGDHLLAERLSDGHEDGVRIG